MISRRLIIIASIVLCILYFGFNFFTKPNENQVVMDKNTVIEGVE